MDDSIQFFIQQIKDNCKWYFGHEVQVITFYIQQTDRWHAIVYPADCTLASASSTDIHLHSSGLGNLYRAMYNLRCNIYDRIADRFHIGNAGEAPVVQESVAPCKCQKHTGPLTVVEPVARSVENEASEEVETAHVTTGSGSPRIQPGALQDIWPVLQRIESTLECIERRTPHLPVETTTLREGRNIDRGAGSPAHSTEQVVITNADRTLTAQYGESSGLPGVSQPDTEIAEMDLLLTPDSRASTPAPHRGRYQTPEAGISTFTPKGNTRVTPQALSDGVDGHTRDLVREEIGRVLAAAMNSLGGHVRGGVDGGA